MPVKPPRSRGAHLNAMRCFEAAARLGGFTAAAEELSITPGAVSQQVKALEEWAGAPLFRRRSQGVVLTPLGASVTQEFSQAFDALGVAMRGLRANARQKTVSIAALPSVAQLWLSPRLPSVRRALPDYEISITALESPPNLQREMFDLSVFFRLPTGGRTERVLADDNIYPVCSPAIAARMRSPADLENETMIHDAIWKNDWNDWLERAGHPMSMGRDGPVFSLYRIAVDEARNGAGVLIGHEALVERHINSGELVVPFAGKFGSGKSLIAEAATPLKSSGIVKQIVDMLLLE